MDTKSIGQIAYEAYGEYHGWLTVDGKMMPSWPSVDPAIQAAWQAAAQAVLRTAHAANIEAYSAWLQEHGRA